MRDTLSRPGTSLAEWALRVGGMLAALALSALILLAIGASPLDAFGLIINGAFGSSAPGLCPDCVGAGALVRGRPLSHLRRGPVEHRHRRPGGAGSDLRHWRPALVAAQPAACPDADRGRAGRGAGRRAVGGVDGPAQALRQCQRDLWRPGVELHRRQPHRLPRARSWKRPGIGSTSGTEPFPPSLWLPAFPGFQVSPVEILLALAAIAVVGVALRGTYFGLRLKAIGKNVRAAYTLGVSTDRHMLLAFAICGALAGLAGWVLIVGTSARHNLFPLISGGYGFLAILVVLLANLSAAWSVPISVFLPPSPWAACSSPCSASSTPPSAGSSRACLCSQCSSRRACKRGSSSVNRRTQP
ncbi:MAG: ABC transporter permease [Anaerolineae bacterium]|nr:ABC transporter permease [Anaerolineae bacterium]